MHVPNEHLTVVTDRNIHYENDNISVILVHMKSQDKTVFKTCTGNEPTEASL